jgi:hypothetical protein
MSATVNIALVHLSDRKTFCLFFTIVVFDRDEIGGMQIAKIKIKTTPTLGKKKCADWVTHPAVRDRMRP